MSDRAIETLLDEERRFPPDPAFAAQANAQPDIYDLDPDAFWEREGRERVSWFTPFETLSEWEPPFAKWYLTARSTSRTTASTATWRRGSASGSRTTGRASRATRARSRTPSSNARSCGWRTGSERWASAGARRSRSTWGWFPSWRSRCSPARGSAR